jgi:hypothetical protein
MRNRQLARLRDLMNGYALKRGDDLAAVCAHHAREKGAVPSDDKLHQEQAPLL